MKRHILIDQLKPGMFLIGIDQSWWKTPWFTYHRLIKDMGDVAVLKKIGVRKVVIDISKGDDVQDNAHTSEVATNDQSGAACNGSEKLDSDPSHVESDHTGLNGAGSDDGPAQTCDSPRASTAESVVRLVEAAKGVHAAAVLAVERIFEGVATGAPIENPALHAVVTSVLDQIVQAPRILPQLALVQNLQRVEQHLYTHVVNVCAFAAMVGVELELPREQLEWLATGALLHDVGFARLPSNLFRKRKGHTKQEHALLQKHTELGVSMLATTPDVEPEVRRIVLEHHERQDGSGYPRGLRQGDISSLSDIVSVCDCLDSMIGNWGSPPPIPSAMALRQLYGEAKAGRFTPAPAERLIKCLGVYPLGSLVELSTGERAVIVGVNPHETLKPSIKLVTDSQGQSYAAPWVVNLAAPLMGEPAREIRTLLDPGKEGIDVGRFLHPLCW